MKAGMNRLTAVEKDNLLTMENPLYQQSSIYITSDICKQEAPFVPASYFTLDCMVF
jgi:hypothetical protein